MEMQEEEAVPNFLYEVCSSLSRKYASERKGILEKAKEEVVLLQVHLWCQQFIASKKGSRLEMKEEDMSPF